MEGKTAPLPAGLTGEDVQIISVMMSRGWSYEQVTAMPYRIWRYLPTAAAVIAEMSNPDRPGNKP